MRAAPRIIAPRVAALFTALTLCLAAPVAAQDTQEGFRFEFELPEDLGELEGMMDDMMDELGPMMDELGPMLEELGPVLEDALGALEGLDAYEAPEVLPNGDIIIRRKRPKDGHGGILPPPDEVIRGAEDDSIWL